MLSHALFAYLFLFSVPSLTAIPPNPELFDLSQLEAGLYLPSDSVSGIFSQIYFDRFSGELQTFLSCEKGNCPHTVFQLSKRKQSYYSEQSEANRRVEIYLTASNRTEITLVARVSYTDAAPHRIEQQFFKADPDL